MPEVRYHVRSVGPLRGTAVIQGAKNAALPMIGAAPSGHPGPLVTHFTSGDAGQLPCPVMIIPGSLADERLEQLS